MQKYQNSVASLVGRPVVGATVTVLTFPGLAAATIYSDNGISTQSNPITTDNNGSFSFYAADGRYSVTISGNGIVTQTISDILLEDPVSTLALPGAAATVGSTGPSTVQTDIDARPTSATLAASSGSTLVGDGTTTVADRLSAINLASYTALRAYAGANQSAYITGYLGTSAPSGTAGPFARDDSDTTSADNGGTIIVASNGKRWKRVFSGNINVRWFGAKGDNATDDKASFAAARDASAVYGTGTVFVPRGAYRMDEFALTNGTTTTASTIALEGEFGGTVISPLTAGKFAVTLNNQAFSQSWWGPLIRNIDFDGTVGGVVRMGCGLYAPREVRLENVSMVNCLVGMVTGDNYYFGGRNLNIRACDVGVLDGTFGTGATTITDLVDGNGSAASLTLPFAMANANGHAGNKHWDTMRINTCRIGWAAVGGSYSPANLMTKPTIEVCNIGLLCINGAFDLKRPWFESNQSTGTLTFNGVSYEQGCIVAGYATNAQAFVQGDGAKVVVSGGRLEKLVARRGGGIWVRDNPQLIGPDVTQSSGGRIVMDGAIADSISVSALIQRPSPLTDTGRAVVAFVPPKVTRAYGLLPANGHTLAADDFTGAAIVSSKLTFTSALTFSQAGGVFQEQKYATVASTSFGINLGISAGLVADSYYCIYLMLRSTQALSLSCVNVSAFVATLGNQPIHPIGSWFALGIVTRSQAATGTPRLVLTSTLSAQIDFGGIQVARFDNRVDAAEFMAEGRFYMTEG